MAREQTDDDFNTMLHGIYDRNSAGESSHAEEKASEPEQTTEAKPRKPEKVFDPTVEPAKWLGQRGGKKGGKTRTDNMTPEERSELAKKAAEARWGKTKGGKRVGNC